MPINKKILASCAAVALLVCGAQVLGNTMIILAGLAAFMALAAWACIADYTLPFLLFFMPWSQILKINPTSFSFYTFAIVLICLISIVKKALNLKRYGIVCGIALVVLTLVSKLIDGSGLSFAYIAFMMLIVLFPVVKEEWRTQAYDLYVVYTFFSLGVIIAALAAQQLAGVGNIAKYIRVDAYHTIRRMCGFYPDPNFYAAQITAAMGGGMLLILRERAKGRTVFLGLSLVFLVYCGMLSGSKSFVVVMACVLLIWIIELLRVRGRAGLKTFLIIFSLSAIAYIASSALFGGLIDVLRTRFSFNSNLSDLTTGRTELWASYLKALYTDPKLLFLGKGFTNVKINGRAAHNTILQIVFQFGVVGSVFLFAWCLCFFKGMFRKTLFTRKNFFASLLIMTGAFMPWLAIDALYFDEFFLMQWFVFVGLQYILNENSHSRTTVQPVRATAQRKGPRLKLSWK